MRVRPSILTVASICLLIWIPPSLAQAPAPVQSQVQISRVAEGIFVLRGSGGNIAASIGDDGVLLIDDGLPRFIDTVRAAVASLSPRPIRIVLNTNWHYDHADGNERLAQNGALIIAHANSRAHMLREQRAPEIDTAFVIAPYRAAALPVVTSGDTLTVHFNGDEIRTFHVPNAHSDGDLLIQFKHANVLHTGDLFFPNAIPFINFTGGGSFEGAIRGAERILELADSNTRVIPGHGPVSGRAEVRAYRDLLVELRSRLLRLIEAGRTIDEVVAANPFADLYEGRRSYFRAANLTRYGYQDLTRGRATGR